METQFCHIAPTPHLDLVDGRKIHLVLAHLIEEDPYYVNFYLEQKKKYNCKLIMDNSAFEMFKAGRPMYPSEKLIEMGKRIKADWIVMSDYPGEPSEKTIQAAKELAPVYQRAGFKTFFVPQGKVGDLDDLLNGFRWAAANPKYVDYIGVSILSAPLAFNVEKGNKLQRFVSRLRLMYALNEEHLLSNITLNRQRIHMLGMLDGPNEVMYMNPFRRHIDTWDSSAAVWLGLNGEIFDETPTGRRDGKFEEEVDFNYSCDDEAKMNMAKLNMNYIDSLVMKYLGVVK